MFTPSLPWIVYGAASIFEAWLLFRRHPRSRRTWSGVLLLMLLAMSQGAILFGEPLLCGIPFFIFGIYRLLNVMRFIYGRMHDDYLYRVLPRSSLVIGSVQTLSGVGGLLLASHHPSYRAFLYVLAIFQVVAAAALLASLHINSKKSECVEVTPLPDKRLPSVSVLIPARNETADLEACLQTLVASTYQKLEILVLDDCSQDRTPEVIKKFAHDGVRFVRGSEPGEVWLPKNAAYDKLVREASGEFLLFCGVDVRFGADDIRTMVSYMMQQQLTMVSVLPRRSDAASYNSIAQQIRYIWELALPRFLAHRPPVLSTLWLIQATALKKYGGMGAVRRNVVPEGYFARELDKKRLYQFLRAGDAIAATSSKPPKEQRETALRVRYPQLHRRPEIVMAVGLFELAAIVGAYALVIDGLIQGAYGLVLLSGAAVIMFAALFIKLSGVMGRGGLRFYAQALTAVFVDLWLVHRSMYLYEFDEVRWKERNVCLPVMHVIPSLPRLPKR